MQKTLLIFAFLIILFSSSCRKLVQDEFEDFNSKITINSIIVQDEQIHLHVSLTSGLDAYELSNVNNANIEMYNQDSVLLNFNYVEKGHYISDYIAKENDEFYLKVNVNNSIVSSSCFIPDRVNISEFHIIENAWVDNEGVLQPKINFSIINDLSKDLFFEAYILIYDENVTEVIEEYPVLFFDNFELEKDIISKSVKISHHFYSNNINNYKYQLIIKSVDSNYYKYVKSFENYNLSRFPDFSNAGIVPTNLFSNINNGYGIFCGYSQTLSDIKAPID